MQHRKSSKSEASEQGQRARGSPIKTLLKTSSNGRQTLHNRQSRLTDCPQIRKAAPLLPNDCRPSLKPPKRSSKCPTTNRDTKNACAARKRAQFPPFLHQCVVALMLGKSGCFCFNVHLQDANVGLPLVLPSSLTQSSLQSFASI
jgi:hypothetical protein